MFAGIGGIGLGLERAGMTVKWAIENAPYAAAVYHKNFPDVEMIEQDITTIDFTKLESVDLLTGGFPCQDISYAGKGAGITGERSGLWKEFWRAIRVLRPRLVLVENVPALLSRGLGVVLGDLAALRYDAEWDCIPAGAVGAPHRRDRFFLLAYRSGINLESEKVVEMARGPSQQSHRIRSSLEIGAAWKVSEPGMVGMVHGVSDWVDRAKCIGNAVVPQVAEFIGKRIMEVYEPQAEQETPDE